jgi:hypothetical protein
MSKKESAAQHFFGRHGIAEFKWEEWKKGRVLIRWAKD